MSRLHPARLARLLLATFALTFALAAPFAAADSAADPAPAAIYLAGDNHGNGGG